MVMERRSDRNCKVGELQSEGTQVLYVVSARPLAPLYETIPFSSFSLAAASVDRRLPPLGDGRTPQKLISKHRRTPSLVDRRGGPLSTAERATVY
jgi:hypothetical protein